MQCLNTSSFSNMTTLKQGVPITVEGMNLSSLARTLGSRVRIPLKVWMSVCVYSVFVLFCVWVAALRRTDHTSKECKKRLRNWRKGQGPTKGCRAIDEWMNEWIKQGVTIEYGLSVMFYALIRFRSKFRLVNRVLMTYTVPGFFLSYSRKCRHNYITTASQQIFMISSLILPSDAKLLHRYIVHKQKGLKQILVA
jgi:hypothetical protein